jgi:hypothetical protein
MPFESLQRRSRAPRMALLAKTMGLARDTRLPVQNALFHCKQLTNGRTAFCQVPLDGRSLGTSQELSRRGT